MKKIIFLFSAISLGACAALYAGAAKPAGKPAAKAAAYKAYSMDKDYFSCSVPADWALNRDADNDEDYKIYEIRLDAPRSAKAPASIFVSFYSKDNKDFAGYQDYIKSNSSNALGETKGPRETYEAAKKITLAGREGFVLASEKLRYLNPESKSDESVQLKEKIYVLPAKDGFYAIKFNAPKTLFAGYLPVFEKVAKSFKGKP
jgi:hypothetical protein